MFEPRNPNFAQKVNESFALQSAMSTLGMTLDHVGAGEVHIRLAKHDGIVQQMGFVHGGVLTTGLEQSLRDVGIPQDAVDLLAKDAMNQTRLLVNNPRPVTEDDARAIYQAAW